MSRLFRIICCWRIIWGYRPIIESNTLWVPPWWCTSFLNPLTANLITLLILSTKYRIMELYLYCGD